MADEQVEQGSEELSTDEAVELVELPLEERLILRLDAMAKEIRDTNARINGNQAIYDRNTAQINELRGLFTEEYGNSKKALNLLRDYVKESMGDEAWQRFEAQQELADLREKAKAPKKVEERSPVPRDPLWVNRDTVFHGSLVPDALAYTKLKGLDLGMETFAEVFGAKFHALEWGNPTELDPVGAQALSKAMKEVVDREVNRARKQATPRALISETTRGTGGGKPEDAYSAWLSGNGPKPSDAEIDRITAPYLTRS